MSKEVDETTMDDLKRIILQYCRIVVREAGVLPPETHQFDGTEPSILLSTTLTEPQLREFDKSMAEVLKLLTWQVVETARALFRHVDGSERQVFVNVIPYIVKQGIQVELKILAQVSWFGR